MPQTRQPISRAFNQRDIIYLVVGLTALALDSWFKWLVNNGARWPNQEAWFEFGFYPNPDFIGSIELPSRAIIGISVVILFCVIILTAYSIVRHYPQMIVGGVWIILGGFSNLFDRVCFGWAVDYFGFDYNIPVFNLADVMILIGVGLLLWAVFTKPKKVP
ncbi:MAG: signal peptidase II [bacterium]